MKQNKANDCVKLYNGVEIPILGFGTWLVKNDVAPEVVKTALEVGYIHIDSAQAYGNEEGVGIAIRNSGVDRKNIFITSKVMAEIKDYETAKKSIELSLQKLGTDYIDLMLIHCPTPWKEYKTEGGYRYEKENLAVWKAMEEAYKEGKLRSIGVSNFNIDDIKNIMNNASIKPMVNQIPILLGYVQKDLIKFCFDNDIKVESYSPLGHGRLINNENVENIRKGLKSEFSLDMGTAELLLSYASSYSHIILPKASSREHMLDNMKFFIKLDDDVLKYIEDNFPQE